MKFRRQLALGAALLSTFSVTALAAPSGAGASTPPAASSSASPSSVTSAAAATGASSDKVLHRVVYVALGDSYSSGPLIPPVADPTRCLRSAVNYPSLVAKVIGAQAFRDVTCSGATYRNLWDRQLFPGTGQHATAPQYAALSPHTTVVTVGIGGNDIGLVGLAISCIVTSPTPPDPPCHLANGQTYEQRIDAFASHYGQIVDAIRKRSPQARILLVGYPTVIRPGGCFPTQPILPDDATYLLSLVTRLDQRMSEQAQSHGATYVDLLASTVGHDSCAAPSDRWIEGAIPLSPAAPLHPNALGMQNAATQVLAALDGAAS